MHTTKQVVRFGKENRLYSEQNVEERKTFAVFNWRCQLWERECLTPSKESTILILMSSKLSTIFTLTSSKASTILTLPQESSKAFTMRISASSKLSTILTLISSKASTILTLPYRLKVFPSLVMVQLSLSILTSSAHAPKVRAGQNNIAKSLFIRRDRDCRANQKRVGLSASNRWRMFIMSVSRIICERFLMSYLER